MKRYTTVAELLEKMIDAHEKPQKEIAVLAGFSSTNFLSMIKHGEAKVPLAAVPRVAKVLGLDPQHLARKVVEEYHPELWAALKGSMAYHITDNEAVLIACLREATWNSDPHFDGRTLFDIARVIRKPKSR
ncbi:hypothetical protein [Limibacillus halophilus]|uniref:Uncharacterized protein n=1 Tax=Limibacillus halophilus TaxID=1579333 RepID=A0A839ST73_9PROT|nr:hypothetical protein [Limibacillus halophilus]MBB3066001.1 hypothetical protein [Limibacillus halophilus]